MSDRYRDWTGEYVNTGHVCGECLASLVRVPVYVHGRLQLAKEALPRVKRLRRVKRFSKND